MELLGVLREWDKGTREEQELLGLGLWSPDGLMPLSGLEGQSAIPEHKGHRPVRWGRAVCLKQSEFT